MTTGNFTPSGGSWTGGNGSQNHGTPDPSLPANPDYVGVQPITLDLDGDGIELTGVGQTSGTYDIDDDGRVQNASPASFFYPTRQRSAYVRHRSSWWIVESTDFLGAFAINDNMHRSIAA